MSTIPLFYIEDLSPLYEDVQRSRIFPDSKFFVDCVPISSTEHILSEYNEQKQIQGFDLKSFLQDHFEFPEGTETGYSSSGKTITTHLEDVWDVLTHYPDISSGTLIPLPHNYVVPGGRFREVYYWDSYFTMLGLQVSKRVDLIQDMVDNFAWLIDQFGFIPNGNRTYYLGRSQPPFFSLMVTLLVEEKGKDILQQYRPQLEKEYAYWMDGATHVSVSHPEYRRVVRMDDGSILNRYWDDHDTPRPEAYTEDIELSERAATEPGVLFRHIRAAAESGWDFSSRWFRNGRDMATIQTTDIIPVDLNCLLLFLEIALCTLYETDEPEAMKNMLQKIMLRNRAIEKYCWSEHDGFYFDYQHKDKQHTGIYSLAACYPLFFNLANEEQVVKVASCIQEKFLQPGGLTNTLAITGEQWDAPNGWAPLHWIAYKAFLKNGQAELADLIKTRWTKTNESVYNDTGKIMEKYNVMDTGSKAGGGEYPNQDGFGWTNGVYLKMKG